MTRIVIALSGFLPLFWARQTNIESLMESLLAFSIVYLLCAVIFVLYARATRGHSKDGIYRRAAGGTGRRNTHLFLNGVSHFLIFTLSAASALAGAERALDRRLTVECDGITVDATAQLVSPVVTSVSSQLSYEKLIKHEFYLDLIFVSGVVELAKGNAKRENLCRKEDIRSPLRIKARLIHNAFRQNDNEYADAITAAKPGDQIFARLRLLSPRGTATPLGFDAERHALLRNIDAYGSVKTLAITGERPATIQQDGLKLASVKFRSHMIASVDRLTAHMEQRPVIRALVFADRTLLSALQRKLFESTGTFHLIAVSGLHLGVCMGFIAFLVNAILPSGQFQIRQCVLALAAIAGGTCYLVLAAWPISGQRALLMAGVASLVLAIGRNTDWLRLILIAALIVLLNDPIAILDGGFWLSFAAILTLYVSRRFYLNAGNPEASADVITGSVRRLLSAAWRLLLAQLLLLTVMAIVQKQLGISSSFLSIPANMIAVPLYSVIVVPLALLATLLIAVNEYLMSFGLLSVSAQSLLTLCDTIITFINRALLFLSTTGVQPRLPTSPEHGVLFIVGLIIALLIVRSRFIACWSSLLIASLLLTSSPPRSERIQLGKNDLLLVQIDVGQGSAYLLKTRESSWLYDTGASFRFGGDAATNAILPALTFYGVKRLDGLIVSHSDDDHAGGLNTIVELARPERLLLPAQLMRFERAERCNTSLAPISLGENLAIKLLWPEPEHIKDDHSQIKRVPSNDQSCVISLSMKDRNKQLALIPGDIGVDVERRLAEKAGAALATDLLVLAHHGSNSSSGHVLLDRVEPAFVTASMGYLNHYGHPSEDVLQRLAIRSLTAHSSAKTGTQHWVYRANIDQWTGPWCMRHQKRHFWQQHHNSSICHAQIER